MKLDEIKKLSPHEFAERYPFLQYRKWDPLTRKYYKAYWGPDDDAVKEGHRKIDEPVMEFYCDDFHGWNDLLLCWAEKVREVFVNNGDGKIPDDIWVAGIKEKYGELRISFGRMFREPYEKIDDLTYMVEHLSEYWCYHCGHIGRSSNEKKLVTYRSRGYWISYKCRSCAKKETYRDIMRYGVRNDYYKKWLNSNPRFNLYKDIFDKHFERDEGDWYVRLRTYSKDGEAFRKIDCHELIGGMF